MTSTIRDAALSDYETFIKLFRELNVDDPVASLERFGAEIAPTMVIAERDGRTTGYAFFRPLKDVVHLAHVVTAPDARRQGVGRALMAEVARRGREAGCSVM